MVCFCRVFESLYDYCIIAGFKLGDRTRTEGILGDFRGWSYNSGIYSSVFISTLTDLFKMIHVVWR